MSHLIKVIELLCHWSVNCRYLVRLCWA